MTYAYQQVTCSGCGRSYVCTPDDDYFGGPDGEQPASASSGVCFGCLLKQADFTPESVVVIDVCDLPGGEPR